MYFPTHFQHHGTVVRSENLKTYSILPGTSPFAIVPRMRDGRNSYPGTRVSVEVPPYFCKWTCCTREDLISFDFFLYSPTHFQSMPNSPIGFLWYPCHPTGSRSYHTTCVSITSLSQMWNFPSLLMDTNLKFPITISIIGTSTSITHH